MDHKTYRFVGVSRNPAGVLAVRYANDAGRARHLARVGHTDIVFLEMEQAERVEECMDALMDYVELNERLDALMDYVELNERLDLLDVVREEAHRVGFAV